MVGVITHGGAGTIKGKERRELSASGTDKAAEYAYDLLSQGENSVTAVREAVKIMEDLPQFNAGVGSVITEDKEIEMDAMIVEGVTGNIGGVMGISRIKNPILLCETIMYNSNHILFAGRGAEKFAERNGFSLIDPSELITDGILERYENWKAKGEQDHVDPEGRDKYGTVGAVARDIDGNLAAATSTGGTLGKQMGRIGDTPIFGAGTYADREIAISATGVGEYIIQGMIGVRIKYQATIMTLKEATRNALVEVNEQFGPMGVICIDKNGDWSVDKTTKDLAYSYFTDNGRGNFLP